jgi:hypothetical protein
MAAIGNSCFRLIEFLKKYSPLKPLGQMNQNLVGIIYDMSRKNCLWQTCLLKNRAEMSNLYKGPSIYASYQAMIHLDKRLQRRRFFSCFILVDFLKIFSSETA